MMTTVVELQKTGKNRELVKDRPSWTIAVVALRSHPTSTDQIVDIHQGLRTDQRTSTYTTLRIENSGESRRSTRRRLASDPTLLSPGPSDPLMEFGSCRS